MQNSLWLKDIETLSLPTLSKSLECDVCIVGGGLSGIYTAYLLAKKGLQVVLLEAKSSIAHGTTSHSTGKLTPQHGIIFSKLLKDFSDDEVRTYYKANKSAIESALQLVPIETYQKTDSYIYAQSKYGSNTIQDELNAYKKLNIPGIETTETELPIPITSALKMENTAQIHPTNFAIHFAKLALKEGASIFSNCRVTRVIIDEKVVETNSDYRINYKNLVLCTHYPIESFKGMLTTKLSIDRSYLIASKASELLKGQYLSVENPTRTIRTALVSNTPYFIYGGNNHKAGTVKHTKNYYKELERELKGNFDLPKPTYFWSAQDPNTPDHIPYIGQITNDEPTLYIATGYRKWGLSNSLVAGEIISSTITKEVHSGTSLYSPSRGNFGKNLLHSLKNIGFVTTSLVGGYLTRIEAPKCTHLGCKTRWNEGDETWDCPCHGSRFDKNGNIIEGPAVYPLKLKK